jgi:hypothetical protein
MTEVIVSQSMGNRFYAHIDSHTTSWLQVPLPAR